MHDIIYIYFLSLFQFLCQTRNNSEELSYEELELSYEELVSCCGLNFMLHFGKRSLV